MARVQKMGHAMSRIENLARAKPRFVLPAICLALIAGCASSQYSDAEYRVESREERRKLSCATDETPACIERIGQPARCFCSSRDSLERLLEDPSYEE